MFESLEFIQNALERQRNKPFLKATMAAAALAMLADGEIQLSERYRLDEILQQLERLKIYKPPKPARCCWANWPVPARTPRVPP